MKKIAVMTSGGDSPGMNAGIRAVVRTGIYNGLRVFGIHRGYQGMIEGDISELKATDVSNIIQRGGTILKTARSQEFKTAGGRQKAFEQLQKNGIEGLILIGGDGTFTGATHFFKEYSIPAIGMPGTIDNDLNGTDFTIGFDTAANTAVEAIDKIRDTAEAHDRIFLIEVMGRDAGHIAMYSGISCGAEHIFIPELHEDLIGIVNEIQDDQKRKKKTNIIVVAEGDEFGGAVEINNFLKEKIPGIETRVTILGHIQRGGNPTAQDRMLASRLGYHAVMGLLNGQTQEMVGMIKNEIHFTPFEECIKKGTYIPDDIIQISRVLTH